MKKMLLPFWLFSMPFSVCAEEQQFTTFHRFNAPVTWDDSTSQFLRTNQNAEKKGTLALTRLKSIDSISPFENSSQIIDDLYFESLMLPDPTGATENLYPLLARELRFAADGSYVIFQIDPRARFQDGTPVQGSDVLYSIAELKNSATMQKEKLEGLVLSSSAQGHEVRFDLKTSGQASRHAVAFLAQVKIIKANTTGALEIGGIRAKYTPTGPYRLTQLGRARLSLIIDPAYWGKNLSTRKGFFNYRIVELHVFPDESAARSSVANESANFFLENVPSAAAGTGQLLRQKNARIQHREESSVAVRYPALAFSVNNANVSDPRIRQALLLAYDFDGINKIYFGGALSRPLSLLGSSVHAPTGPAAEEVQQIIQTCGIKDDGLFESYGHAQFAAISDKRIRLLTASRLLQEAGLRLENGILKRPRSDGTSLPFQLKILVREHEYRMAQHYRTELMRLGITAVITQAEGESYRNLRQYQEFDLISSQEGFLNKEGMATSDRLNFLGGQTMPCLSKMISKLESEIPDAEKYRYTSEAIARIHQALTLSIFTGSIGTKNYFFDERLKIPPGLSAEGIHMYGYWQETPPDL